MGVVIVVWVAVVFLGIATIALVSVVVLMKIELGRFWKIQTRINNANRRSIDALVEIERQRR